MTNAERSSAREKLITAAITMVRSHGFTATSVDDLCRAAGVTKGAFFHHFASKDALGIAAAKAWSAGAAALFDRAPYRVLDDPLARVLGYIAYRRELITGPIEAFSCYAGTTLQEVFATSEPLRAACGASILDHAASLEADIEAAIELHGTAAPCTARSLALHTQAVLQGAFILAKAADDPRCASQTVDHLLSYVELLFGRGRNTAGRNEA